MNYIVAVSGGVDSVVLLDMMSRHGNNRLIVAHFDHGIRPESDSDARFVAGLARSYQLPFESIRENLGPDASEALARRRRYAFLDGLATKHNATVVTAHHQDDAVETVALNLLRGTGWRGLAVFSSNKVVRPLASKRKSWVYEYALANSLEWVEDETNQTDAYTRNILRRRLRHLDASVYTSVVELARSQRFIRKLMRRETDSALRSFGSSRYPFITVPDMVAIELLRSRTKRLLTRPQLASLLLAIKTAKPGTTYQAGAGVTARFTPDEFIVQTSGEML